ncbi:MAG: class I SAM-dependent methyltransferase [Patescibacteria group bacterium]|nr:class I SAM-dependent methyltransferase [Patescibacteria group bacterium]
MTETRFDKDYFRVRSTYRKFKDSQTAVRRLSDYYFCHYLFLKKKFLKELSTGARVLEIGCGYSGLVNYLVSDSFKYTGIDVSDYIIEEMKGIFPNLDLRRHDIAEPLPGGECYKAAIALEVFEHLADPEAAAVNVYNALEDGGLFLMSVPNPRSRVPFTDWHNDKTHISVRPREKWEELLEKVGFGAVHSMTISTIPFFWKINKHLNRVFISQDYGAAIFIAAQK